MPTSLYDASVLVFLRYLERLLGLADSAEAFARACGRNPAELLSALPAPDMLPFERQVVIATNFTLRASFPLAGELIPTDSEFPATFPGLHARVDRAARLLRALDAFRFVGAETRVLESHAGDALIRLPAPEFLFQYALPNFFFHVTAAYTALRNQGVPLGKKAFDGYHSYMKNS